MPEKIPTGMKAEPTMKGPPGVYWCRVGSFG